MNINQSFNSEKVRKMRISTMFKSEGPLLLWAWTDAQNGLDCHFKYKFIYILHWYFHNSSKMPPPPPPFKGQWKSNDFNYNLFNIYLALIHLSFQTEKFNILPGSIFIKGHRYTQLIESTRLNANYRLLFIHWTILS